jgi:hypothetical protein
MAHFAPRVLSTLKTGSMPRVVAYRLQADRYGDLDDENKRLLDHSKTPEEAVRRALDSTRRRTELRPGTVFSRARFDVARSIE